MGKYEDAARIEAAMSLPAEVVEPTLTYIGAQDAERGNWPSPRDAEQLCGLRTSRDPTATTSVRASSR